jgi:hypothetical protein
VLVVLLIFIVRRVRGAEIVGNDPDGGDLGADSRGERYTGDQPAARGGPDHT